MTLKLTTDKDPNKLAERIAALIGHYKCTVAVDQEQRIAVIVNAAGRKYAETIRQETAILELERLLLVLGAPPSYRTLLCRHPTYLRYWLHT